MSVPSKSTVWGEVSYEGKTYGVLYGFHVNDEILKKYGEYKGIKDGCFNSSAPWTYMKPRWRVEDGKLYLTGLCKERLLTEVMGSEKLLADWLGEMKLLVEDRKLCKTHRRNNEYVKEMRVLHLKLNKGVIVSEKYETELYKSNELKDYINS